MDLKDIDLNLLTVFNRLLRDKQVSKVADSLGLSQSTVSNALGRLRKLLGDDLFLRTSRGMEPTPFAKRLEVPLAQALALIHDALNQDTSFDPATSTRTFTIAMTDVGEIYLLPALAAALRTEAPQVVINTVRNPGDDLRASMDSGTVDLAIGELPQLKGGYFQRRLLSDRYVCMFRAGHPLADGAFTLEDFSAAHHAVVRNPHIVHGDDGIERAGIRRDARLVVSHFSALGHILGTTDLIATVSEGLARIMAGPFGLTHREHPAPLPQVTIHMFWHARFHQDPANQWLRNLLARTLADKA